MTREALVTLPHIPFLPTTGSKNRVAVSARRLATGKENSSGSQFSDEALLKQLVQRSDVRLQKELLKALLIEVLEALQKRESQEFVSQQFKKLTTSSDEEGVDGHEGLASESTGLSSLRHLKVLDVHDYVHSSIRASYLRGWLQTRGIEE